ncbi:hypothetical protein KKG56_04335 [bacterium]|nr:hypothetical protein [bacterium]
MAKKKKAAKPFQDQSQSIAIPPSITYIGLLIGLLFLLFHTFFLNFNPPLEDAYISFRYAKNFIHGNGIVFNAGEYVEGYTNFLWILMLSGFKDYMPQASVILGIIFALGTIIVSFRIAQIIFPHPIYNLIPVILLAFNPSYALWSTGGLETHFFSFLVICGIYFYLRQHKHIMLSSFFFAIATLARPEGFLFLTVSFIYLIGLWIVKKVNYKDILVFFITAAVILIPYLIFKLWYYRELLPNTFYAKVIPGAAQYATGFDYAINFFSTNFGWTGLVLLLIAGIFCYNKIWFTYLVSLIVVFSIYIFLVGGDCFPYFRFFVPILSLFCLLIGEGIIHVEKIIKRFFKGWEMFPPILVASILGYLLYFNLTACPTGPQAKELVPKYNKGDADNIKTGKWFAKVFPASTKMAINPAGVIPYYTSFHTIDMLGLNDKHIARQRVEKVKKGLVGHMKFDANYVFSKKPDIIIVGAAELLPCPANIQKIQEYYQWISQVIPGDRALLTDKRLFKEYELVAANITSDSFLPFFLCKGSNIKDKDIVYLSR